MVVLHELDLSIGSRGDHFWFGLVFFFKVTKPNFFFKKTKTSSNWPVLVRFDLVFYDKTGSNWFDSVLFRFGSVLARFFLVWVGLIWFGFFGFRLIKPKLNWTGWFFQNFNRFNWLFFKVRFFRLFFFFGFLGFLVFLLTPNWKGMLGLLCLYKVWFLKERWSGTTCISSMDMCFILKNIGKVEKHITVRFVLKDHLLMSLKLTIMRS